MMNASSAYPTHQIRALERAAIERSHISEELLMSRAGKVAFLTLQDHWPHAKSVCVVCGKGNNAGDGYVLANLARSYGYHTIILQLASTAELSGVAKQAAVQCELAKIQIEAFSSELLELHQPDVIVDAILGIGLAGNVCGEYASAISSINHYKYNAHKAIGMPVRILALDVPSGLEANTGSVLGVAIEADITVTFIALKPGLLTGAGPQYAGECIPHTLNVPDHLFLHNKR